MPADHTTEFGTGCCHHILVWSVKQTSATYVKNIVKYAQFSVNEEWRIGVIADMKNIQNFGCGTEGLVSIEASEILNILPSLELQPTSLLE